MCPESDPTTAAGDEGRPGERTEPGRIGVLGWAGVAHIVGSLAGVAVLVGGVAFVTGWAYTDALYEQLGIPSRALDLGPTDYATANVEMWYTFALVALAAAAGLALGGYLASLGDVPGAPRWWPRSGEQWLWVVPLVVGLVCLGVGVFGVGETGDDLFVLPLAMGAVLGPLGALTGARALRTRAAQLALAWLAAAIAIAAVLSLPGGAAKLGQHDAEALLAGPQEGSGARHVAAEPLGLPGERHESGVYVTESVGVIRATDNAYFVVVRGTEIVYCLPAARVLRMEYTPDGR